MRRPPVKQSGKPAPKTETYDVLKDFWHRGRMIRKDDQEIKDNGLTMPREAAIFLVTNGTLSLRKAGVSPKAKTPVKAKT